MELSLSPTNLNLPRNPEPRGAKAGPAAVGNSWPEVGAVLGKSRPGGSGIFAFENRCGISEKSCAPWINGRHFHQKERPDGGGLFASGNKSEFFDKS